MLAALTGISSGGSGGAASGGGMAAMLRSAGSSIVQCRKDLRVVALLQEWWDAVQDHMHANGKRFSAMDEDTYFDIFTKIYRAMVSEFNEWEAEERNVTVAELCDSTLSCSWGRCLLQGSRESAPGIILYVTRGETYPETTEGRTCSPHPGLHLKYTTAKGAI